METDGEPDIESGEWEDILHQVEGIISLQEENLNAALAPFEEQLADYGGIMDYYVEDLDSGTILSNSGTSLPDALSRNESSLSNAVSEDSQDGEESSDYVYYVSLQYDGAGNVGNVSVRCRDDAKHFLNTVQTAGHEKQIFLSDDGYMIQELSQDGQSATYQTYDDSDNLYPVFRLKLTAPSNMRVIYGLTQEQYDALLQGDASSQYRTDLYLSMENSYRDAGVVPIYLLLLLFCAVAGLFWAANAGRMGRPHISGAEGADGVQAADSVQLSGRNGLYVETAVILAALLVVWSVYPVIRFTAEYENGIFLRSICTEIGNGGRIWFLPLDRAALFLFFAILFAAAFLLGTGLSGIRRDTLRKRSLICKYWHKIYLRIKGFCTDFYMDLVHYDIGTDANRIILKVLGMNFFILMLICCFWFAGIFGLIVYTVIVYFILKKYVMDIQEKYRKLLRATSSIAQGNLDTALSEDFGIFESYKSQLRRIQVDFKRAVEEEVKSQRMKSELITNVSHDLKTPLTAIITYIDLLKEPGVTPEKQAEYLDVLQKKSNRLKVLIEDLFEISKASSKAVTLQIVDVDICNLLRQAYLEQEDRINAAGLDFRFHFPERKILLSLDSQKTYRIFDNLYTNIIKYALKDTRVYVSLTEEKEADREFVRIELKNISASELSVDPNELTERFVRGDGSRNTEGSGLGLAIAKSFAELQGGSMRIEVDGDLFKVNLTFPEKDMRIEKDLKNDARPAQKQPSASPVVPPAPWDKRDNRFYRSSETGQNPAAASSSRDSTLSGKIRSWMKNLWFGKRP